MIDKNAGLRSELTPIVNDAFKRASSAQQCALPDPSPFVEAILDVIAHYSTQEPDGCVHRAAMKGQVTKIKNRVGKGVCPCCTRSFINLQRHMAGQHPDWAPDAESAEETK